MNTFTKRTISLLLVLLTLTAAFSSFCTYAVTNKVQTTDSVRLRSSAKIESDNIIRTLSDSEELTLLKDSTNGWAYVCASDGTKGYCSIDYLKVPADSGVTINGVTTEDVNFRKGPSSDYDVIELLSADSEFTVLDNTQELWVKAKTGSKTGYIYRTYTKLGIKLASEDVVPPDDVPEEDDYPTSGSALESLLGSEPIIDDPISQQSIVLSDTAITVEEGSTFTLTAYTSIEGTASAVRFRTSDESVLSVSDNGVIKAKKSGTATVTAFIQGADVTAECFVEVIPSDTVPKEDEIVLSSKELTMLEGNHAQLTADKKVKWKTSDKSIVSVSGGFLTAASTGTATITAYTDSQSADCVVTVKKASAEISISKAGAKITVGKTYYNGAASSKSIEWTSSDPEVATVTNGFITAVSKGKAVITAKNSLGERTCLVTVQDAEPVRFAYASPNTASKGETITLYAVTDTKRTDVKFEVYVGSKTVTVNATDKKKDGNTYVWSGTTTISKSGTYEVVAYAKAEGDWQTCSLSPEDSKTTVFVRTTKDLSAETMETRRATDELISLIAGFEGYSASVYFDTIANNIPTLGYGKVLYLGDSFYNDMTRNEAYAYLVQAVNNDGYTSSVNSYLNKYNINRNQQQFDALVSFVYNLGSNSISGDNDFKKIFTAVTPEEGASDKDAYINATNVNLRSGPSTSDKVITTLGTGDLLTLVKTEAENNWYQVKTQDGKEGYVYADYVTKGKPSTDTEFYLSKINVKDFTELMLQYHHAGPTCVNGLLYRRIDELEVFFNADYVRDGSGNKYGFSFTCPVNSSTKL
ncbi:MAG: SH3 domain-containing protein [Ruminococcus sp.]|nr:SH3 domain-containing protein [Ruminococcus sp.]